jgi:NAD(P)-dependent dehydrogenase (short-subunit alcohol dehydrogenase family)
MTRVALVTGGTRGIGFGIAAALAREGIDLAVCGVRPREQVMEAIAAHLLQSKVGRETELYGYALHVEVVGMHGRRKLQHTLWHTHPPSDGSVPEWAGLRAYTRNVGIPFAIGAEMLAKGLVTQAGIITPEEAFDPWAVFKELEKRQILVHSHTQEL